MAKRFARARLRNDLAEGVVARMAEIARARLGATGFCTDDHFRAAGFSAAAVKRHGDRARHRAALVMTRAHERATTSSAGDAAGGNHRGETE